MDAFVKEVFVFDVPNIIFHAMILLSFDQFFAVPFSPVAAAAGLMAGPPTAWAAVATAAHAAVATSAHAALQQQHIHRWLWQAGFEAWYPSLAGDVLEWSFGGEGLLCHSQPLRHRRYLTILRLARHHIRRSRPGDPTCIQTLQTRELLNRKEKNQDSSTE